MTKPRVTSLFCEDVRIEHDQKCTLVGVIPSVGFFDDPVKFHQLFLLFSVDVPTDMEEAEATYEVSIEGHVTGLQPKFIRGRSLLKRPDGLGPAESWQVITYVVSDCVEIIAPAKIIARIQVGPTQCIKQLEFYPLPKKVRKKALR